MGIAEHPVNDIFLPQLSWVGHYSQLDWHPHFLLFDDLQKLSENTEVTDFIIINLQPEQQDKALKKLRADQMTALSLIFVVNESPLSEYLANGLWQQDYLIKCQQYLARKEQLNLQINHEISYKLLSYLWLHQQPLNVRSVPFEKHLYDYPLLNVWGIKDKDSFAWLDSIKKKAWIEKDKLVNRVRLCKQCLSGHLNYIDSCPECDSIDIEEQISLRCFNCGHIANKDEFKKSPVCSCPNCLQALHTIGKDHQRAVEKHHCNDCDSFFIEAIEQVNCMHCLSHNSVDDLLVRSIYSYSLASLGESLARRGISQMLFEFSPDEAAPLSQFSWIIEWQNKLAFRHQQEHLIVAIEAQNIEEIINEAGEKHAFEQIDALKKRLSDVVRTTDLFSQYSNNTLLVFFPMTSAAQIQVIYPKIKGKLNLQSGTQLQVKIKAFNLPVKNMTKDPLIWLGEKLDQVEAL